MTETNDVNQFGLTSCPLKELRKETSHKEDVGRGKKTKPQTVAQVDARAEIKMFHIEQSEMNWARPEEREEKKSMGLWLR